MVSDYTNLNFIECLQLPFDTFLLYFKHAFINNLKQSEEGREYLETAKRIKQTSPDLDKLKEMI